MNDSGESLIEMSNTISTFWICSYKLRSLAKNDTKLQMEKLEAATLYHDIVGMLDTHLIKDEVDIMIKNNRLSSRISMILSLYLVKPEEL